MPDHQPFHQEKIDRRFYSLCRHIKDKKGPDYRYLAIRELIERVSSEQMLLKKGRQNLTVDLGVGRA
jgi:hypothetical protein